MNAKPEGFYIYAHYRKSDGRLFYIGKGKGRRAWVEKDRGAWWQAVSKKHGFNVLIIEDGLDEVSAYAREALYIEQHISDPNLVNIATEQFANCPVRSAIRARMEAFLAVESAPELSDGVMWVWALGPFRVRQRIDESGYKTVDIRDIRTGVTWPEVSGQLLKAYPNIDLLIGDCLHIERRAA